MVRPFMRLFVVLMLFWSVRGSAVLAAETRVDSVRSTANDSVSENRGGAARSVILFIADGFGYAHLGLGRGLSEALDRPFVIDGMIVGTSRTRSGNSRITDSAAGATALASGVKTNNGVIGMDVHGKPVPTVLEAAKAAGKATGVVATSTITHATPAGFTAHVHNRGLEAEIAAQQVEAGVDVLFGGGVMYFVPARRGVRTDGRDLIREAALRGVQIVSSRTTMLGLNKTPAMGLFATSHMAYEVDRGATEQPSLADMTGKAIELLSSDPDGFFLMVEASRIDHAAHDHDPVGVAYDVLALNDAVNTALDFARQDGSTLVVLTADHETGGLGLARHSSPGFRPEMLVGVRATPKRAAEMIRDGDDLWRTLRKELALTDLSEEERAEISGIYSESGFDELVTGLKDLISRRVGLGWTTGGHSAIDVPLGAFGPGAHQLVGSLENDEIGRRLFTILGVDAESVAWPAAITP